ncbi:MAG: hypothetical protein WAQ28_07515 [Bacteroidia bacterium]
MSFKKKGFIFQNNSSLWWSKKYAGLPTVELLNEETLRIYYYSMTDNMDGRIAFIDVEAANPANIIHVEKEPVLDIGEIGMFDDSGVCPSAIFVWKGKKYMSYLGVQRAEKVPYLYFAGLAVENADGRFERVQKIPVLDRTPAEPYSRSATTVLTTETGLKMWYVSVFDWFSWNNKLYPKYNIRLAESTDGINWKPKEKDLLLWESEFEFGFGRPWVMEEDGIYKLYYSIRSTNEPYKMGYAESVDGEVWIRKDDEFILERSAEGWDSEMVCYPSIVNTKYGKYLFYNGNSHGATGFGYAKWEQ